MKKRLYIIVSIWIMVLLMTGCSNKGEQSGSTKEEKTVGVWQEEQRTPESLTETSDQSSGEVGTKQAEIPEVTMDRLFRTALLPVGSTMYVWGGGWNEEDNGAGTGATTIGLYPRWAEFAGQQDDTYVAKEHRYEILNGLDCSGYIGWLVYNLFEQESGRDGYVFKSTETAAQYSALGWGEYLEQPEEFRPGDIVSMKGHVWLSLGTCEDGSVALVHASPPGVSLCGTLSPEGEETQAVALARRYMEEYYPDWQKKYPNRGVGHSYLEHVTLMRWNEETLSDAQKWQAMRAEQVLEELHKLHK